MSKTPVWEMWSPVKSVERAGEQTQDAAWWLVKVMPLALIHSRPGALRARGRQGAVLHRLSVRGSATAGRFLDAALLDETTRAKVARGNAIAVMHVKA
ncbi:hypothetical protein LJE71_16325 [Xanthobacter autotrophicus]|uniref:hypothetical protein n=1 Tax=Xanthobacter autotrophicus TaxID=280 RepID=UPI001E3594FE|nr:hypothetical protein [Xanthobacter autotrophicus]UDQ92065.1 hypothetical protein LJE71_16325 [Xanthobacter autotrophicus]